MADEKVLSLTIPPPVMGMSSKQPLSEMDPLYSPEMENFFPAAGTVDLRKGYLRFKTISTVAFAALDLFEFRPIATYAPVMVHLGQGVMTAISTGGIVTTVTTSPAINSTAVQATAVNFKGKLFIKPVIGAGSGSDVYVWTGSGNAVPAAFTGPSGDDKALWLIDVYKSRLYFSGLNTASIWYGGVDAETGTLTEFSFASQFRYGSYIMWMGSISLGSDTPPQYFVVISEGGDVVLYQGDYPGSATWSLAGRYQIPPPPAKGCFFYWGHDVIAITRQGVISLSELITAGPRGERSYLSDEVNLLFNADFANVLQVYRIGGIVYPAGNYLLISLGDIQWVMNLQTRAWTRFTNQDAWCWCVFNDGLYFGTEIDNEAVIFKADTGYFDDAAGDGTPSPRTIVLRHAYNYLGDREGTKQFVEALPVIYQSEGFALTADADVDYADTTATQTVTPDTTDTSYKMYRPSVGLRGIGKAISFRIDGTVTTKRMSLQATEIRWMDGGVS